ncbi:MAG: gamma-glutamylcyclotransferase [Chromatiales bacterium]|nr:gamma-glutamylcyclotransferase [Chromatiales bacterium]
MLVGPAWLEDQRLVFHKLSLNDGSAKCDVVPVVGDAVYGVLYEMSEAQLSVLDEFEGLHRGYERRTVSVQANEGQRFDAQIYVATLIDSRVRPYDWYKRHVLEGAREAGLPQDYIRRIETMAAVADSDAQRAARELAVYGES